MNKDLILIFMFGLTFISILAIEIYFLFLSILLNFVLFPLGIILTFISLIILTKLKEVFLK
jgi:hypothetical protein